MRILASLLLFGVIFSLTTFGALAQSEEEGGVMTLEFQTAKDSGLKQLASELEESEFFSEMVEGVNETFHLPRNLPVYFRQCNTVNAFYDRSKEEIIICYELVAHVRAMFDENESNSENEVGENTLAATAFFFLHEMGHAFIDLMEIPVTGKEEDAVDDLAALTLIEAEEDEPEDSSLYSVADTFDGLSDDYEDIDDLPFWDEHSLTQQRLYGVLCLLYGSNAKIHADLVGEDGLPKERAQRCAAEYKQKRAAWNTLLGDYIKE